MKIEPGFMKKDAAARFLGIDREHFAACVKRGRLPRSYDLCGAKVWCRDELVAQTKGRIGDTSKSEENAGNEFVARLRNGKEKDQAA